ncbi:hypothetical protein Zm00014a_002584 [Zea mays]|nr:hypothetical protein Zm00014a_002584 [Zea mays]
MTLTPST